MAEQDGVRFTRRALFVTGAQCGLAAALGARMYQLQVIESGYYSERAERSRIQPKLIAPVRGEIFARDGEPLAINRQNYRVVMIREQADDPRATLEALSKVMELPSERIDKLEQELRRTSAFIPVLVAENLSWKQFAQINANAPALPGVASELGLTRHYPEAAKLGHIVGYVAAASERDVERAGSESRVLKLPGMRIGKNGVERALEGDLRGKAGLSRVEKNVHGRTIRELHRQEGVQGENLTLTVDLKLQEYAMRRLGEESGAATVMDIYNGDVLALASSPGFDPNGFVLGLSSKAWNILNTDEKRPLTNKAIADQYPPGSTFKMLVALAGLDAGVIGTGHSVFCGGHTKLGKRKFHCWKRGGHGHMNMHNAVKHSCDVYFYDIAKRIGIERMAQIARQFGIGVDPDIDLPQAAEGLMPDADWKRAFRGEPWHAGETLIAGIGQGYVLATPLQLAIMTARIANGGYKVTPRLVRARGGVELEAPPLVGTGVSERHVEVVRKAMYAVCNEVGGTARRSRIAAAGYEMSGKTGTAQGRTIGKAERATGVRKNSELPWHLRDHALFVAFAPSHAPRYAISVVVQHGGGGSSVAAPIARDIMLRTLFKGDPPEDAIPKGAKPFFSIEPEEEDAEREDI